MDAERISHKESLPNKHSELADSDSDIEEVLCESLHLTSIAFKVSIHPGFFLPGSGTEDNFEDGNSMAYDSTPPPKGQIIGATEEYIEQLKSQPRKMDKLVPIFTVEEIQRPTYVFRNFPRAITDYSIIEPQMTSIIPNGGIKKLICKNGKGEKLVRGNNVLINYYMYVEGNPSCMESNKRWKKPHSFVLGERGGSGVIPVLNLGGLTMRVKEIAAFLVLPDYAYGKMGSGLWVPAKKRTLFVIEVLSKLPSPSESSNIINMVQAERKLLGFDEIYKFAKLKKADGNKDFAIKKNVRALGKYIQAATCLIDASTKNEEEENRKIKLLHQLYENISITSIRSDQVTLAIEFCEKAIELPIPEDDKAYDYLRCAKALCSLEEWAQAKPFLDTAALLLKNDPEVIKLQEHYK